MVAGQQDNQEQQDTEPLSFGAVIKKYRNKNEMSQPELAELMGVSRNTITNWENDRARPEVEIIRELCTMFGIPLHELFGIVDDSIPNKSEYKLLSDYRKLNPANQRIVSRMISIMLEEQALEGYRDGQSTPDNEN